jgi:hypothetical protein
MELNSIIFPAPKKSYSGNSKNVIWISGDEPKLVPDKTYARNF